jgi:hypothetical protein
MFVFISWSGEKSRRVAEALRDWLPCVIHQVEPFMSSEDIYAGTRWQAEIAGQLAKSDAGIVCVTRANQRSPWLNFEAGALAKVVEHSRVIPVAIDLEPVEIEQPLGQFQGKTLDEAGIRSLVTSINQAAEAGLSASLIDKSFSKWWSELADRLATIGEEPDPDQGVDAQAPAPSQRSAEDMMAEVLAALRSLTVGSPPIRVERSATFADLLRVVNTEIDAEASELLAAHRLRYGGIIAWLSRDCLDMPVSEIAKSLSESVPLVRRRIADVEEAREKDPEVVSLLEALSKAFYRGL